MKRGHTKSGIVQPWLHFRAYLGLKACPRPGPILKDTGSISVGWENRASKVAQVWKYATGVENH